MADRVTTSDDPRLVDYRDLRDTAARRRIEGDELFIAEGPVAIERLITSGHRVRSVVVNERKYDRLRDLLDPLDAPTYIVSRDLLHGIVGFDLHRGAIAAADRRMHPALDTIVQQHTRVAVIEGLNDPENLGAIARSARALGIGALVLDPTTLDPYTRRTVRVSMGEILLLPAHRTTVESWPGTIDRLHQAGFETWAMTPGADSVDIWTLTPPTRLAVILGAEGPGLSTSTLTTAQRRVHLPIHDQVDSLNVAAAAAVTFAVVARPDADGG